MTQENIDNTIDKIIYADYNGSMKALDNNDTSLFRSYVSIMAQDLQVYKPVISKEKYNTYKDMYLSLMTQFTSKYSIKIN